MNAKLLLTSSVCALVLCGCSYTQEGLEKDASRNSQKAAEGAQNIQRGMKEAGKDMGAATILTPKIKTALMADIRLNDPSNLINVNSTSDKVTLDGHVSSLELKLLAGDITMRTMKEDSATQTLENNLVVAVKQ